KIAKDAGLITAEKKDSQGLCFVGKISLPEFLQQQLKVKTGEVIEIPADLPQLISYQSISPVLEQIEELSKPFVFSKEQGVKVAEHQGAHFYTIGQRKGLHIGGRPLPSVVLATDIQNNIVFSGQGDDHPGLNRWALFIKNEDFHTIKPSLHFDVDNTSDFKVRIRYRQALQEGVLLRKEEGYYVLFKSLQRGITPGQFAAFYDKDELVASGVIFS